MAREDSFLAGVLHPASGIDHIAGFFLVGLLASRLDGADLSTRDRRVARDC